MTPRDRVVRPADEPVGVGGPRGAVRIEVHAAVRAEPSRFVELSVDLAQLRELHPRLLEADWLDAPAVPGSRAEICVALPAALGLLTPIVGRPQGTLTLLDHRPGRGVRYRLDADRVEGVVELVAHPSPAAPAVTVRGGLWAKAPLARAAMVPAAALLDPAMTAAVRRTVVRADELLLAAP